MMVIVHNTSLTTKRKSTCYTMGSLRKKIAQLVPDFVIEVRSETDQITKLRKKMSECWMANGVQLGWLIDPIRQKAWIYRPNQEVETVENFENSLSGEDVLSGFLLDLRGLRVVLLGAGGAGRVAALKLAAEGAAGLFLVNRTRAKAEAIAAEIRASYLGVEAVVGYPGIGTAVDLLLNATSLGLKAGDAAPWNEREFSLSRVRWVYDMVYRPAETSLLKAARAAGCEVANGLGMLLHQGARALELWTGRTAPVDVMREALHRSVYGA